MRKAKRIRQRWKMDLEHEVMRRREHERRQIEEAHHEEKRRKTGYSLLKKLIGASLDDAAQHRMNVLRELEGIYHTDLAAVKRKELAGDKKIIADADYDS